MYKVLNFIFNFFFITLFLFIVNSCAYYKIVDLEKNETQEINVYSFLGKEYKDFAKFELYDMHDEIDANYFAYKGLMAVKEKKVFPENPSQWDIPANKLEAVKNRFNQINQLLEEKKHLKYPEVFSKMLLGYDCWVEQLEENWQIEDIERCKNKFITNYNKIISLDNESVKVQKNVKKNIDSEKKKNEQSDLIKINEKKIIYLKVYFQFDSYSLDEKELFKLQEFVFNAKANSDLSIYIEGHTDTSGPDMYNQQLSNKRADFIKNYLLDNSVTNSITTKGFGEKKPLLTTKDNVKEQKNRRAEISLK